MVMKSQDRDQSDILFDNRYVMSTLKDTTEADEDGGSASIERLLNPPLDYSASPGCGSIAASRRLEPILAIETSLSNIPSVCRLAKSPSTPNKASLMAQPSQ